MPECDNKSVGVIVRKEDKILLIERKKFPHGFACPAGHVDDHGSFEDAARDELREEVGLTIVGLKLLTETRKENKCRREGGDWHYWKVYEAQTSGDLERSESETKQADWFDMNNIRKLAEKTNAYLKGKVAQEDWDRSPGIEPVWLDFFEELKII